MSALTDLDTLKVRVYSNWESNLAFIDHHQVADKLTEEVITKLKGIGLNVKPFYPQPMGGGRGLIEPLMDLLSTIDSIGKLWAILKTIIRSARFIYQSNLITDLERWPGFRIEFVVETDKKLNKNNITPMSLRAITASMIHYLEFIKSEISEKYPQYNFEGLVDINLTAYQHRTSIRVNYVTHKLTGEQRIKNVYKGLSFKEKVHTTYWINKALLLVREDVKVEETGSSYYDSPRKKYYFILSNRVIADYYKRQIR